MISDITDDLSIAECYKLLNKSLSEVAQSITGKLEKYQQSITSQLTEANDKIKELEHINKQLFKELELAKREERKNNIIIFGVKEDEGENIYNKVTNLLKTKVSTNVSKSEISVCYRFGKNSENKHRPIAVKFVTLHKKQEIFSNCHHLKGSDISISNDLTKEEREAQKVLRKHLKEARDQGLDAKIKKNLLYIDGSSYTVDQLKEAEKDKYSEEKTEQPTVKEANCKSPRSPGGAIHPTSAQKPTVTQKQSRTRQGIKK